MDSKEELTNFAAEDAEFAEMLGLDFTKPQKRKEPPTTVDAKVPKQPKVQQSEVDKEPKEKENRAIWITNVPQDATFEEIYETFKKYGMIDVSVDKKPRIKFYHDDKTGEFKGEVLVLYFRPESVELAIRMMDDYALRPGKEDTEGRLKVEPSDNSFKKNIDPSQIKQKMARKDRKQVDRNRAELNRQLAEWSDNEEELREALAPKKNKWAKNAIIHNAFRPFEFQEDKDVYNEVRDDMLEVAEKYGGETTKITIFDLEPRGIVVVRFKTIEAAEQFQRSPINGKSYNARSLHIELAEDRPKFRKSPREETKLDASDSDDG